jgi:DNA-directed RNA polymerase specialized sigma24 family protein
MTLALAQLPADHDRLAALVAELPPLQRRVVEGYFLEHCDVHELAGEQGLTLDDLSAVRILALRALRDGFFPFA